MMSKLLKRTFISCLTASVFMLNITDSYSLQQQDKSQQQEKRVSPVIRSPSSSFGTPNVSRQHQNKIIVTTPQQPQQQRNRQKQTNTNWQNKSHNNNPNQYKFHNHHNNTNQFIYYYNNSYIDPYYFYPGDDGSYSTYNSDNSDTSDTTAVDTSTDLNGNGTDQNSYPSYDPASLPNGTWISESSGNVPDKAIVYQINNGLPLYYCRVQYNYTTSYGVLTPNTGCYIQDQSTIIHFNQYDVLTSPN